MDSQVIKLDTVELSAYSIIGAYLCSKRAESALKKYWASAAAMVFDLAMISVNKNPELEPSEINLMFKDEFANAISKHIANQNIGADYETKHKNMIQAFNKVSNALELGLDIKALGSANACEKKVTEINEQLKADTVNAAIAKSAESIAKREGISVTEATERLKAGGIQGTVEGGKIKGQVSDNESPILQDIENVKLKELVDNLSMILSANPLQANEMIDKMIAKSEKALSSITTSALKHALSNQA